MLLSLLSLLSLAFSISLSQASSQLAIDAAAGGADTCATAERAYPSLELAYPSSGVYRTAQSEYWNKGCQKLSPTCILFPKNADEASKIIDILSANDEGFAIKSGGHNANCGFASVERGPLISTARMKQFNYDFGKQTVRIGSGHRWQDVAVEIQKFSRSVVGGRVGHVGVGGYLLGGGLSFQSTQYGWASTHVLEYEVVVANGTIIRASATEHPELHRALQGGGNLFGVVTAFTLRTFPGNAVWGGHRMYNADKTFAILGAVREFTEQYPDPKAAIIATSEVSFYGNANFWTVFFYYDGPQPPSHVFENFTVLEHFRDTTGAKLMSDLLYENNQLALLNNTFITMATETVPMPKGRDWFTPIYEVHTHWTGLAQTYVRDAGYTGLATIAYQPLPQLISDATKKYGGNVMDMGSGNRLILELDLMYGPDDDNLHRRADNVTMSIVDGTRRIIDNLVQTKAVEDLERPLFLNDAYRKQDVWGRFKERNFMKKVRDVYDPVNFFGQRTNGWKL